MCLFIFYEIVYHQLSAASQGTQDLGVVNRGRIVPAPGQCILVSSHIPVPDHASDQGPLVQ